MSKEDLNLNEQGAAFNMGIAMTIRLDGLFREAAIFARAGLLTKWYDILLCIERECSSEMKDKDEEKVKKVREAVVTNIPLWLSNPNPRNTSQTFNALHNFEVVLRKVVKDRGLGMPNKADSRYALGN